MQSNINFIAIIKLFSVIINLKTGIKVVFYTFKNFWDLFYTKFYVRVVLDLQKYCENSTEGSHVPHMPSPLLFTSFYAHHALVWHMVCDTVTANEPVLWSYC